jgi:lipoyl synthase
VMDARPEILNHNTETVPRLYGRVRPKAVYTHSLELLRRAKDLDPEAITKSGVMVGLGETEEELHAVFADLRAVGVDVLTVGQYLRPSAWHLPIDRYYTPEEFAALRDAALALGFRHVEAGPLVRSSYHAHEQVDGLRAE